MSAFNTFRFPYSIIMSIFAKNKEAGKSFEKEKMQPKHWNAIGISRIEKTKTFVHQFVITKLMNQENVPFKKNRH